MKNIDLYLVIGKLKRDYFDVYNNDDLNLEKDDD